MLKSWRGNQNTTKNKRKQSSEELVWVCVHLVRCVHLAWKQLWLLTIDYSYADSQWPKGARSLHADPPNHKWLLRECRSEMKMVFFSGASDSCAVNLVNDITWESLVVQHCICWCWKLARPPFGKGAGIMPTTQRVCFNLQILLVFCCGGKGGSYQQEHPQFFWLGKVLHQHQQRQQHQNQPKNIEKTVGLRGAIL